MREIDTLTSEQLAMWRNIRRQIWLFENVTLAPEDINSGDAMDVYDLLVRFLEGAIKEYDIDETKEFTISDITGLIYYMEDK